MFQKEIIGLNPVVPTKIVIDRNLTIEDFVERKNNIIFIGVETLENWLESESLNKLENFSFNMEISKELKESKYPYYLYSNDDRVFMVQNVMLGELNRALKIAIQWRVFKINPGFNVETSDSDIFSKYPYVVYELKSKGMLEVVENETKGKDEYLEIIYYRKKKSYAALLPLRD